MHCRTVHATCGNRGSVRARSHALSGSVVCMETGSSHTRSAVCKDALNVGNDKERTVVCTWMRTDSVLISRHTPSRGNAKCSSSVALFMVLKKYLVSGIRYNLKNYTDVLT